jgi:hypothetical protein
MFELKIGEQVVNLKWGTYAMKLWCDLTGKTVDDFFLALAALADTTTQQGAFEMTVQMLRVGYKYANKDELSEETACEWIDQLGGIIKVNSSGLVDYINYVVSLTMTGITPLPGDTTEEKKSEV